MDFKISNIYVNDKEIPAIPSKRDDVDVEVTCSNDVVGTWNMDSWSLDLTNYKKTTECNIIFKTTSSDIEDDVINDSQRNSEKAHASESSSNEDSSIINPKTGTFINIIFIVGVVLITLFIIRRAYMKSKFYKI